MKKQSLLTRFLAKVSKLGPKQAHMKTRCYEWLASVDDSGYGKFSVESGGWDRAHRVIWKLAGRPLHPGELVLHKCDYRKCTRLSHLYKGTKKHNAQDREKRGRGNHPTGAAHGTATHPGLRRGSKNGRAKMTEKTVVQLLQDFKQGNMRKVDLSRKYNLTKTTVGHIVSGKLWPHVEGRV